MKGLNEQFLKTYAINDQTPYYEEEIDAYKLLSSRRFDFLAKYAYIKYKEEGYESDYAEKVYHQHLDILTQGTFHEFGDSEKVNYEKFITVFHELMDSIREHGFDSEKSKVPLSKDMIPLNGAHRVSCCIYYEKKVQAICFPKLNSVNINYEFFRKKGMKEEYLDYMASLYGKIKPDSLYGCCIWPKAMRYRSVSEILQYFREFGDIVYTKKITFSYQGLMNLMIELYGKETWTGTYEHIYGGLHQKVEKCYDERFPFYFLLFEKTTDKSVRYVKEKIRSYFELDTNSIHITDDDKECQTLCELLLRDAGVHFLNHSQFLKRNILEEMNTSWNGQIMDAISTLCLYGVGNRNQLHECEEAIREDMIYDPENSFLYQGMRLMSLPYIIKHYPQYKEQAIKLWEKEKRKKPKNLFLKKLYGKLDYGVYVILNRLHIYDKLWRIRK